MTPSDGVLPNVAQTLFVTCTAGADAVKSGQTGHVPGTVVTVLVGPKVAGFASHVQRVNIVCAGPAWEYVGKVLLQLLPLSVE